MALFAAEVRATRHETVLAAICQRLPAIWQQAFDDVSQTCFPRAILEPGQAQTQRS